MCTSTVREWSGVGLGWTERAYQVRAAQLVHLCQVCITALSLLGLWVAELCLASCTNRAYHYIRLYEVGWRYRVCTGEHVCTYVWIIRLRTVSIALWPLQKICSFDLLLTLFVAPCPYLVGVLFNGDDITFLSKQPYVCSVSSWSHSSGRLHVWVLLFSEFKKIGI